MDLIPKSFDDLFDNFPYFKNNNLKCDIYEKDGKYHIEVETPGFKKEDITVKFDDGYLTICCHKQSQKEEENKNYVKKERSCNECKRQIYVGNIEENDIKAKYDSGLLHIEVPKIKDGSDDKEIKID